MDSVIHRTLEAATTACSRRDDGSLVRFRLSQRVSAWKLRTIELRRRSPIRLLVCVRRFDRDFVTRFSRVFLMMKHMRSDQRWSRLCLVIPRKATRRSRTHFERLGLRTFSRSQDSISQCLVGSLRGPRRSVCAMNAGERFPSHSRRLQHYGSWRLRPAPRGAHSWQSVERWGRRVNAIGMAMRFSRSPRRS